MSFTLCPNLGSKVLLHWLRSPYLAPTVIAALSILGYLLAPGSTQWFEFSRTAIDDGQWWRILTGNLLHTNHWHLLMNLAGLLMLSHLFGHYYSRRSFLLFTLANSTLVGLGLYLLSPSMEYYVGLSGYLHGLFIWGALLDITKGVRSGWLLFAGVVAKTFYEQMYGANEAVSQLINANVAVDAHFYGVVAALPLFAVHYWHHRPKP